MPTNVLVNDTVRVQVTFRDWETVGEGEIIDPVEVLVDVLDANLTPSVVEEVAILVEPGVYYYDWTPTAAGKFYIEFRGEFADGQSSMIREEFNVVSVAPSPGASGETLEDEYVFVFATGVDPLYVDPEELTVIYPEANNVEVMEAIHRYSLEVQKLFGKKEISAVAIEYIRAAALCSLSKIYDYGVYGDETNVSLADLSFSSRSYPKMKITRSNAANWCELAGALRLEMLRGARGAGMRQVVAGSAIHDPMPKRHLRDKELPRGGTRWPN